jgi:iron complex outermembrane recepter protein
VSSSTAFRRAIGVGLALASAWPALAAAQVASPTPSAATASDPADDAGGGVRDIVVTATRRQQSIQDVGVAVNAFSSTDLRNRGIDNVAGLADAIPGVKLLESTGGGVPVIIIRGVGLQDFRINNTPTAAIYVDEIYQTSVAQAGFSFFDLERLEVLKGPQGGLYGRNTTGGALQVVSRKPSLTKWSGYAEAGYARFGTKSVEAAVGGPISDKIGIRIAGRLVNSATGQTRSVINGASYGAEDRFGLRGLFLIKPTDKIEVLLKIHGGKDRSETPLLRALPIWIAGASASPGVGTGVFSNFVLGRANPAVVCPDLLAGRRPDFATCGTLTGASPASYGLTDADKYATASNPLNKLDNSWIGGSANVAFDFGRVTFTSITSIENFKVGRFTDWDATPTTFQHIDYRSNIDAVSQEYRLAYNSAKFNFVGGVNYAYDSLTEASTLFANTGIVPLAFRTTSVFQPYRQRTDQWAGYGRIDWRFAPTVTLVAEARYTSEKKKFTGGTFLVDSNRYLVNVDRQASFGDYSGKIALEYRPDRDFLLYGSISRGYKSGGFFGGFATSAAQTDPYRPETVIAYEAGIKSEFLDRRLRANAAAYYYDYHDLQGFGRETIGAVQIQRLSNIGDGRVMGAEADITLVPTPGLTISANAAYVDAKVSKSTFTVSDSFGLSTKNPVEGQRLTNTPRWNLAGLVRYDAKVSDGLTLGLQADASYRSSQNLGFINILAERPLFFEPGYALFGARVSLASDSGWELSAFVKNLGDKTFRTTSRTDSFGGFYEVYGTRRTYGASARYSF